MSDTYVCYDIKGIQRYIFSVPKLKCIIGGSILIDQFDEAAQALGRRIGVEYVFSGGGRGGFWCPSEPLATKLEQELIEKAHEAGLDLRIGRGERFSDAVRGADQLYPYCPEDLRGKPCSVSGIWPCGAERADDDAVHPLIARRMKLARQDSLGKRILEGLTDPGKNYLPQRITQHARLAFLTNVNPSEEDDPLDRKYAVAAQTALGNRNRWAIVALDGNDMGLQFRDCEEFAQSCGWTEETSCRWLRTMSETLRQCTLAALVSALGGILTEWVDGLDDKELAKCVVNDPNDGPTLILPVRPLVVGGDDVTLLVHSSLAIRFAQLMTTEFARLTEESGPQADQKNLWHATGNRVTMSAGVLFTKTSFPLHSAVAYAESLLGSAKGAFRNKRSPNRPTPAAIDWETVTESLIDTPADRRQRELVFQDSDLKFKVHVTGEAKPKTQDVTVRLTCRPYAFAAGDGHGEPQPLNLARLETYLDKCERELPPSVRARILPALQRPWSERVEFLASIAKRHAWLCELLWEPPTADKQPPTLGPGWQADPDGKSRATFLPDVLSLLDERHRMNRPTAGS